MFSARRRAGITALGLALLWGCDSATRPQGGGLQVPPSPGASAAAAGGYGPSSYAPGMGQALVALPSEEGEVAPAGARSLSDRPDEAAGFSVHGIYLLPADAPDEALDRQGQVGASLQAQGAWLKAQSGGSELRLDTYQGQPDVSFLRSTRSASALRAGGKLFANLMQELDLAGFTHPLKSYAVAYGGDVGYVCSPGATVKLGEATKGRAVVFLKACLEGKLGNPAQGVQKADLVLLHELIHALGYVGPCAPHHQEGDHTQDDPKDLMAPLLGSESQLDPGRDDYYGHGRKDCPDLARSPFLQPLPAQPDAPGDRPWVAQLAAGAVAYKPSLQAPLGLPGVEELVRRQLMSQRQTAGQKAVANDPKLLAVAREVAKRQLAKQSPDLPQVAALAGSVGTLGGTYFSLSPTAKEEEVRAALAKVQRAWWKEATPLRWGIGAVASGNQVVVAMVYGANPLDLVGASLGAGPQNTLSLTLRLKALEGQKVPFLRAKQGQALQVFPTRMRSDGPTDLFFSLPKDGNSHEVAVFLDSATQGEASGQVRSLPQAFGLRVDTAKPLASALSLVGGSSEAP